MCCGLYMSHTVSLFQVPLLLPERRSSATRSVPLERWPEYSLCSGMALCFVCFTIVNSKTTALQKAKLTLKSHSNPYFIFAKGYYTIYNVKGGNHILSVLASLKPFCWFYNLQLLPATTVSWFQQRSKVHNLLSNSRLKTLPAYKHRGRL